MNLEPRDRERIHLEAIIIVDLEAPVVVLTPVLLLLLLLVLGICWGSPWGRGGVGALMPGRPGIVLLVWRGHGYSEQYATE